MQNLLLSMKAFGLTLQGGAEVATAGSVSSTSQSTTAGDPFSIFVQALEVLLPIIMAAAFNSNVKHRIQNKIEFSGVGWGLANGILGGGILWVIIAHASINKEIEKIKDKKYKKYAQQQMKDFVKTYGICLAIWIVILMVFFITNQ